MIIEQIPPELTWKLRRDVLYPGMMKHQMEMEVDSEGIHFGAYKDDKLVGVVSVFQQGTEFQFRKLAVDVSLQNNGIGRNILNYITNYIAENGGTRIWCNARTNAIGFYHKLGYIQTGEAFAKNGLNYVIMEKTIIPVSDPLK